MSDTVGICYSLLRFRTNYRVSWVCLWDGELSQSVCNCYALPRLCLTKVHRIRAQGMNMTSKTMDTMIWTSTGIRKTRYLRRQWTTVTKVCFVYERIIKLFWLDYYGHCHRNQFILLILWAFRWYTKVMLIHRVWSGWRRPIPAYFSTNLFDDVILFLCYFHHGLVKKWTHCITNIII